MLDVQVVLDVADLVDVVENARLLRTKLARYQAQIKKKFVSLLHVLSRESLYTDLKVCVPTMCTTDLKVCVPTMCTTGVIESLCPYYVFYWSHYTLTFENLLISGAVRARRQAAYEMLGTLLLPVHRRVGGCH
jgi:hypothetical protein